MDHQQVGSIRQASCQPASAALGTVGSRAVKLSPNHGTRWRWLAGTAPALDMSRQRKKEKWDAGRWQPGQCVLAADMARGGIEIALSPWPWARWQVAGRVDRAGVVRRSGADDDMGVCQLATTPHRGRLADKRACRRRARLAEGPRRLTRQPYSSPLHIDAGGSCTLHSGVPHHWAQAEGGGGY
jgi:hypothetical protein